MNPVDDTHARLDAHARQLHGASLRQVSPQTLARLRAARHAAQSAPAPAHAGHWRWLAATAFTAVLAVGVGLQLMPADPSGSVPESGTAVAVATPSSAVDEFGVSTVLDEDPDLYLWLASSEAQPLAMESTP